VLPLRIGTITGVALAGIGLIVFLEILVEALLGNTPRGWASMMAGVLTLAGVQLMMLGIIGEYLGRLFLTVNGKPQYVVRDVQRNDKATTSQEASCK
jgi:undecaprenyl-phosphate 4-deoxy-4-formamido-L-arabinose transferase